MTTEQSQLVEAVVQELRAITMELQLLRSDLRAISSSWKPDEIPSEAIPVHSPVAPGGAEEEAALAVYDWLTAKGITVKNYREQNVGDAVFDQLAGFLGERFRNLTRVHEYIRRSLSTGNSFTLNLSSRSQEEIADSTQFCSLLSSYAFLSFYKYNKSTKTIYAAPQRVGKVINFFTGGWFERFLYLKTHSLLSQSNLEFTCLLNPQIAFVNGDDFELDLLFLIENHPLWIECKTGDYQAYIAKYAATRKLLGVPKPSAILVILDIPGDLTANLTNLYDITVANEENFLGGIGSALGLPGNPYESEPITVPVLSGQSGNLSALLNRAGLRPVPQYRQQAITELIRAVESSQPPFTMFEMKLILFDIMAASKSQLQDILNAVIKSGCLIDEDGQMVQSFVAPFSRLISSDPSVIEGNCIDVYARAVLEVAPDYFNSTQNIREFERTVGGRAPSIARRG